MLALEKSAASDSSSPNLWISALRAAAGVARQATANQQDVIHAVTDELSRLQLRGGVSLMTDEGQLLVQSRSLPKKIEDALESLTGQQISGYRFDPDSVDIYRQVLQSGEALFTDDRSAVVTQIMPPFLQPMLPKVMKLLGAENVIIAPLILGQIVIGTINVSSRDLSPDDIPMVSALADHVAIALGHVRARSELESSLQLQQLRSQVAVAASSALELPLVLERIVDTAIDEIGADAGAVALIDKEQNKLSFPYARGIPAELIHDTNIASRNVTATLDRRRPLVINDYQNSEAATEAGLASGLQAVLGTSLQVDETAIGLLMVFSFKRQFNFSQHHADKLLSIASIASAVIQNAHLYSQAKRRAEESQALIHTARSISSLLDADTVLQEIAQQANLLLDADGSRIHLIDQDSNMLNCVVAIEPDAEAIMDFPIAVGQGLTGMVVETGEPQIINDPVLDPRGIQVPGTPLDEAECLVIVPLSIRQRTMGAMAVRRLGYERPFTQDDLDLLMGLGAQAAISIENAHLYGHIESQAHVLEQQVAERTRELSLSEARFRSLVESAQAGIFQLDQTGHIEYTNQALLDMFGLDAEEILGKRFTELRVLPDDEMHIMFDQFTDRQLGRRDPTEILEIEFQTSSGQPISTLMGVSVIKDDAGNPQGLTGVITDISERKKLEKALEAERDRLETLLENIGDAVMVNDLEGRILFVNPAWERIHGYSVAEVLGKEPGLLRSPQYSNKDHDDMLEAIRRRHVWQGEATMQRRDGTSYEAAVIMTPIPGSSDKDTNYVTVMHDISALKEVDRLKSQFVSDVSHELRTPLTNIRLYLDLLERVQDKGRVDRYLETLSRESDRLANLIDDLLSLSRLDVGATTFQPRMVDLNQLLTSLVADRTSLATKQGLAIEIQLEDDLPQITGDERLLGQIFTNLLTNAMNYTAEGGTICIRAKRGAHQGLAGVIVEVEDTGLGIAPEEQVDIFKRFFRGDASRSTGAPGTGLGLAICEEIAQRHGGLISVSSEGVPGQGSCFAVWLPIEDVRPA